MIAINSDDKKLIHDAVDYILEHGTDWDITKLHLEIALIKLAILVRREES